MKVAGMRHLFCDPMVWIPHRVQPLSFWPCLDCEWVWLGDAAARTLGWAPPVRAWLCWGILVGVGSSTVKLGAFLHSGAAPSAKKWVRSEGKSGLPPNSLSTSNQTCFLGFSSFCGEAWHCCALSFDSWDLACNLGFSMEQWSHSSAGQDHGGVGEGDWHWLGHEGEGLWHHLNPLLPLEWILLLPNWDCLSCCSTSRVWSSSSGPQECLLVFWRQFSWPLFTS